MNLEGYIDGNGLVSNAKVPPGTQRASDNGVLFTCQAILLTDPNWLMMERLRSVALCIDKDGYVHRAPNDPTEDAPDDFYGAASAGFDINIPPRMWGHVVLIYLWLFNQKRLKYLAPLMSPLVAVIIALSNLNTPKQDTSNRLLTWTICQALKKRTLLPGLAARFWEWRQRRIYGSMSELFAVYFEPGHPFIERVRELE